MRRGSKEDLGVEDDDAGAPAFFLFLAVGWSLLSGTDEGCFPRSRVDFVRLSDFGTASGLVRNPNFRAFRPVPF